MIIKLLKEVICICGVDYKIILKGNGNDRALLRANVRAGAVANDCNIEIRDIAWFVRSIDHSNENTIIVQRELIKKNNMDLSFYDIKTFFRNVPDATIFLFDLVVENVFKMPQYVIVTYQNNDFNEQSNVSSIFKEMDVTECFRKVGSVPYPDNKTINNYGADNYNVAYNEIVNFNRNYNRLLDSIQPYKTYRTFKSSYIIHLFDSRYQRDHIGAQTKHLNFKFARGVADIICHALVLTRKIVSFNIDDSKMVHIVS